MLINMQNGATRMRRIFLIHNTHDNGTPDNSNGRITDFGDSGGADESMWKNNVQQHGGYAFRSNFSVTDANSNIRRFLPSPDTSNWSKNLSVNNNGAIYPGTAVCATASWSGSLVDYANGNFTLAAGSPGKGAATDGYDIGVDMSGLKYFTRGAM